jgi:hypothetical protein
MFCDGTACHPRRSASARPRPLAGTEFFTAEVLTLRGLVTYYVLFFIHLESRPVEIAGITVHPDEPWMKQIAHNVTMKGWGALRDCCYLLHDRDTKFTTNHRDRTRLTVAALSTRQRFERLVPDACRYHERPHPPYRHRGAGTQAARGVLALS